MIDRLRSHLKKAQGFTLIELLVVIAIIAILVVIVIVAINPVQRLADATDRTAASNVRSTGTLIATCVTTQNGAYTSCNTNALVAANGKGNVPANVTVSGTTDICADQAGNTGSGGATAHWYRYQQSTGTVATLIAAPAACP